MKDVPVSLLAIYGLSVCVENQAIARLRDESSISSSANVMSGFRDLREKEFMFDSIPKIQILYFHFYHSHTKTN